MRRYRVFFDATVWISALINPSGLNGLILSFAEKKLFDTFTSSSIQGEVSRWISRQKKPLELSNHRVAFLQIIRPGIIDLVEDDLSAWLEIPETDRHVIAGAVKGNADIVISNNIRHLRKPSAKRAIPHIFTPLEFVAWFNNADKEHISSRKR